GVVRSIVPPNRYLVEVDGLEMEFHQDELLAEALGLRAEKAVGQPDYPPTLVLVQQDDKLGLYNGLGYTLEGYAYLPEPMAIRLAPAGTQPLPVQALNAAKLTVDAVLLSTQGMPPPPARYTYKLAKSHKQQTDWTLVPEAYIPTGLPQPKPADLPTPRPTALPPAFAEVDLHLEALTETQLDVLDALGLQLRAYEQAVEDAQAQGCKGIILIHGVGQGVLRAEIWKRLKERTDVRTYQLDSSGRFGQGATRVQFK
ncbi:MAG: Smr/MutS family protein, partial [Sphingobacteriia bacterium]